MQLVSGRDRGKPLPITTILTQLDTVLQSAVEQPHLYSLQMRSHPSQCQANHHNPPPCRPAGAWSVGRKETQRF